MEAILAAVRAARSASKPVAKVRRKPVRRDHFNHLHLRKVGR